MLLVHCDFPRGYLSNAIWLMSQLTADVTHPSEWMEFRVKRCIDKRVYKIINLMLFVFGKIRNVIEKTYFEHRSLFYIRRNFSVSDYVGYLIRLKYE